MTRRSIERVYVWDRFVRFHHWGLAALVMLDSLLLDGGGAPHRWVGYMAAGLVCGRFVWGFIGSRHARFSTFFPTPARMRVYLGDHSILPRGHNPLGAIMVLLMLGLVGALGLTGWLMGTDTYWGEAWLEDLHESLSVLLLIAVALHVAAVVFISLRARVNLPRAMLTGYKDRADNSFPFRD